MVAGRAPARSAESVPRGSARDTAAVVVDVLLPLLARGLIIRRPRITGLLDRIDADRQAVRRIQRLHDRYGAGPLRLRLAGCDLVLVLAPAHAQRVLAEAPEPFAPANVEKRAALSHFQPHGVLISAVELEPIADTSTRRSSTVRDRFTGSATSW